MIYLIYDMTRDYMLITYCYVQAVNNKYILFYFISLFFAGLCCRPGRPVRKSIDYLLKAIWRW